jgi:hypothetical protein
MKSRHQLGHDCFYSKYIRRIFDPDRFWRISPQTVKGLLSYCRCDSKTRTKSINISKTAPPQYPRLDHNFWHRQVLKAFQLRVYLVRSGRVP